MPRVRRDLELPFLPAPQAEIPANPLDPMNTHDDSVIGQILLQALRSGWLFFTS
jgi:hypothetical protein